MSAPKQSSSPLTGTAPPLPEPPGQDATCGAFHGREARTGLTIKYLQAGLAVFPLGRGKRPLSNCRLCRAKQCGGALGCLCGNDLCHSFYAATLDPIRVIGWFQHHPDWNLGVCTGQASALVVLDIDFDKGGQETLQALRDAGLSTAACPVVYSGSGRSVHYYYRHPGSQVVRCSVGLLGPGVDVRGDGGYAVAAGSLHPSTGMPYVLSGDLRELPPWQRPVVPEPSGVRRLSGHTAANDIVERASTPAALRVGGKLTRARVTAWVSVVAGAQTGSRRSALFWAASRLGEAQGSTAQRKRAVHALAGTGLAVGLPAAEVVASIVAGLGQSG